MRQIGLKTAREIAAFLGQWLEETAEFRFWEEQLSYSAIGITRTWPRRFPTEADAAPYVHQPQKLANRVYASRLGNGDEHTGDGWKFRGRGPPMLTGRANYREAGQALGLPLEEQPDLVAAPPAGFAVAAWFWSRHGCDLLAVNIVDPHAKDDPYRRITMAINGAATDGEPSHHLMRADYFNAVLAALAMPSAPA